MFTTDIVKFLPSWRVSTLRIAIGGFSWIVGRIVCKIIRYRWLRDAGRYDEIPCIWQSFDAGKLPAIYRMLPFMMQVDKAGALLTYLERSRDSSGNINPLLYVGASIAFEPTVNISDSKCFSQILNDLETFPKYRNFYYLLDPILGKGLVTSNGEEHRVQRKIITPVFHFAALKSAMKVIERNALVFVEKTLPEQKYIITQNTFKSFTLSVITDYAFSGAFDKQWMLAAWHNILQVFILQNVFRIFVGDFVRYLPNPCSVYVALVRRKIASYLSQRREFLRRSNLSQAQLLTALDAEDKESGGGGPAAPAAGAPALSIDVGLNLADQLLLAGCPTDRIIDQCSTFLFAGEDTTSSLLSWAAHELARHPAEQRLVRDELRRVLGPGPAAGPVPLDTLRRLERLTAVLKETLRLWPPVPFLPRVNRAGPGGLRVAGRAVPPGAVLELNIFAAHRDAAVWPEPDAFRPARWLGPGGGDEARHPYAFLPFLAGPRNCIGQKFALQARGPAHIIYNV